ncbi:DUF3667 domain-containing protein [Roseateles asaccharophilus]|uniref:DUF3667 domain-containing protein n=1 Tax=Roseateles asaccharophilus TaxID=582607 RepID=A0ABU2A4U5_9BURK|nr:DUF3667 domain-containing protein [Roseateles asaccharophilus]MDR7332176.1 hypothetical protein [Roseateles asaccharophilus]
MSTTHPHPHAPELPYCRNCHFTLATPRPVHCGHCGQETDLHPPSVREMFTEYLGHYVAFDGPLWRTLAALLFLPGHLTNAYFHGRRRRYVLPLRVYLSASFIFFIGWALLPQGPTQVIEADPALSAKGIGTVRLDVKPNLSPREAAAAAARAAGKKSSEPETLLGCHVDKRPEDCTPAERWLTNIARKAEAISFEQWKSRTRALAPYAMLAMQPIFASLLLAAFAGSGRRYAEHFVFSLHSHSLWFLALLLTVATGLEGPLMFAVFGHGLVAMRRVYGLGWWGALCRGLLLSFFYFVLLAAVAAMLVALIAVTS